MILIDSFYDTISFGICKEINCLMKILNKRFDVSIDNFESERGLTIEKYVVIKVSKSTALRDITGLIGIECIKQIIVTR